MRSIVATVVLLMIAVVVAVVLWSGSRQESPPESAGESAAVHEEPAPAVEEAPDDDDVGRRHVDASEPSAVDTEATVEIDRRILRVLGADALPLEGVSVATWLGELATDAAGEITLVPPDDEPLEVSLPTLGRAAVLLEPLTEIVVEEAVPIEARFTDLETGSPLAVRWRDDDTAGTTRVVGWAVPGAPARALLEFEAPAGWAAPPTHWVATQTARRARGFVLPVPVPRAFTARVRVTRASGEPAIEALVTVDPGVPVVSWGDAALTVQGGVATISGLPFVRGERVHATAEWSEDNDDAAWDLSYRGASDSVVLDDPGRVVELSVALPAEPEGEPFEGPSFNSTIGIGGSVGDGAPEAPRNASLRVRARLADGTPGREVTLRLSGPELRWGTTDDEGVAVFADLQAGLATVRMSGCGVVTTEATIELRAGESVLDVREAVGRSLVVEVVDAHERPLPGASAFVILTRGGADAVDFVDAGHGVQMLLPRTDAAGRVCFDRLPAEVGGVAAHYGTRSASIDLDDPTTRGPVRVVIPGAD